MDDDSLPPPAYSEQEFDRKVSVALEESLTVPQPSEDEEWEVWDEAKFEAAAKRLVEAKNGTSSNASSSSSSTGYLNEKRAQIESVRSWTSGQSMAGPSNYRPVDEQSNIAEPEPEPASVPVAPIVHNIPADDDDDEEDDAPPPFTPVGPSLDGPPFEEVVFSHETEMSPPEPIPFRYASPAPSTLSPPRSPEPHIPQNIAQPSNLPQPLNISQPFSVAQPSQSLNMFQFQDTSTTRYSMPVVPQNPSPFMASRPVSSYAPASSYAPPLPPKPLFKPHVPFNSSIAYNKQPGHLSAGNPAGGVDATAFYNSAVTQYLKPGSAPLRPQRMAPPPNSWIPAPYPTSAPPFPHNSDRYSMYSSHQPTGQGHWPM